MLSQRCDKPTFKNVKDNINYVVETKFDGERFQLHMKDGLFKYFSRRGFDFTDAFGANFESGLYTPTLKDLFLPEIKSVILDGEMMGWNKTTNTFGSKGNFFTNNNNP